MKTKRQSTHRSSLPDRDMFLLCPTPAEWIEHASCHIDLLLLDHANCEKKAAATAMSLLFRYSTELRLQLFMSRLAREELRHFEQVQAIIKRRGIAVRSLPASRYAGRLRAAVSTHEPARLVDTLLVGAFIEARSCERFEALVPVLDSELAAFYGNLVRAEERHFQDYLSLAIEIDASAAQERIATFSAIERQAIMEPDADFSFHSGRPVTVSDMAPASALV